MILRGEFAHKSIVLYLLIIILFPVTFESLADDLVIVKFW